MFGKGKIVHHLENIHNDFESLNFANYIRQITSTCKDKRILKLIDKHLKRYQKICKKDCLSRRNELFELCESLIAALELGACQKNKKEMIDLLMSSSYYLDIIDGRFEGDLYPENKNVYIRNNYNVSLNDIPIENQYPSLKISNYNMYKVNKK